jgi:hypothetical protein
MCKRGARTVAQPMGRDNGSHTTYLVSEAMCTASLFLEPTVAMSSD